MAKNKRSSNLKNPASGNNEIIISSSSSSSSSNRNSEISSSNSSNIISTFESHESHRIVSIRDAKCVKSNKDEVLLVQFSRRFLYKYSFIIINFVNTHNFRAAFFTSCKEADEIIMLLRDKQELAKEQKRKLFAKLEVDFQGLVLSARNASQLRIEIAALILDGDDLIDTKSK